MPDPADPRTLVIGYNGAASNFTRSPLHIRPRGGVPRWLYSSLLRFNEDLELEGDLAERWEASDDGLSYTFHLLPGVTWHDGAPLTASDVVFTAELLQQPHRYFRNTLIVGGEAVRFTAIDDLTVRVDLAEPRSTLPASLTPVWGSLFLILPEHLLRDGDEEAFEAHPIGTGPFRYGGYDDDGNLVLEANASYVNGGPLVDRVVIRFFERHQDRLAAFEAGELDVMLVPGRDFTDADARRGGGRLLQTTTNTIVQFAMNCRHPLFTSVRVRQAIASAVDRAAMVRAIDGEEAVPAFGPVRPESGAFQPSVVERHPFNPDRARQLLADEGWEPGPDGILRRDGREFRFAVIFPPDPFNYALQDYAEAIRDALAAIGIATEVRPVEYWSGMKPAWRQHDFEAFIYYDTFYVEPDLFWSWHSSMPKRPTGDDPPAGLPQFGYGVTGYANAEVDRLLEGYRATSDRAEQRDLVRRAQAIMADEVASLWLYNYRWKNVVHDRVRGTSAPTLADGTSDLVALLRPERIYKVDPADASPTTKEHAHAT